MNAEKKQEFILKFLSVLSHPGAEVVGGIAVEDVIWSSPGVSPISGEARGVAGVMKRAATISAYGVKVEILHAV